MNADDPECIFISQDEAGLRLDTVLARRFAAIKSRSYFETLFKAHKILVNGLPAKKRYLPAAGDEVEINWLYSPELELKPENIALDIVYEDDSLLVVNKPAGLVVHPATGNWSGALPMLFYIIAKS